MQQQQHWRIRGTALAEMRARRIGSALRRHGHELRRGRVIFQFQHAAGNVRLAEGIRTRPRGSPPAPQVPSRVYASETPTLIFRFEQAVAARARIVGLTRQHHEAALAVDIFHPPRQARPWTCFTVLAILRLMQGTPTRHPTPAAHRAARRAASKATPHPAPAMTANRTRRIRRTPHASPAPTSRNCHNANRQSRGARTARDSHACAAPAS